MFPPGPQDVPAPSFFDEVGSGESAEGRDDDREPGTDARDPEEQRNGVLPAGFGVLDVRGIPGARVGDRRELALNPDEVVLREARGEVNRVPLQAGVDPYGPREGSRGDEGSESDPHETIIGIASEVGNGWATGAAETGRNAEAGETAEVAV